MVVWIFLTAKRGLLAFPRMTSSSMLRSTASTSLVATLLPTWGYGLWFFFFLISCSCACISCQCHFDSSSFVLLVFFLQTLAEDEPEKYQSHFSEYIKRGIDADNLEELYKKVHAAIRADPTAKKSQKQPPKEHKRCVHVIWSCSSVSDVLLISCFWGRGTVFGQCSMYSACPCCHWICF